MYHHYNNQYVINSQGTELIIESTMSTTSVKLILKNITVRNDQTRGTANDFATKGRIKLTFNLVFFLMEWKTLIT